MCSNWPLTLLIHSDVSSLWRIKEQLPDHVEYWQIKMCVALMMVSTGFVRPSKQEKSIQLASPTLSAAASPHLKSPTLPRVSTQCSEYNVQCLFLWNCGINVLYVYLLKVMKKLLIFVGVSKILFVRKPTNFLLMPWFLFMQSFPSSVSVSEAISKKRKLPNTFPHYKPGSKGKGKSRKFW